MERFPLFDQKEVDTYPTAMLLDIPLIKFKKGPIMYLVYTYDVTAHVSDWANQKSTNATLSMRL